MSSRRTAPRKTTRTSTSSPSSSRAARYVAVVRPAVPGTFGLVGVDAILSAQLFTFLKEYGVLTEEQARFYAGQMVLALQHMHEKHNMVYRDIKPENMLLDRDGYIKLIDFGFAKKLTRERSTTAELMKTYSYVGTPEYMAPEKVGRQGHTGAADLWALGILVFELLTGSVPFRVCACLPPACHVAFVC